MSITAAALQILIDGDFRAMRRHWAEVLPHLPGPKNDAEAEQTLHIARTQHAHVPFRLRAWSHRWLTERDLPSGLPDHLKPRAEQICPRVASAVGISYDSRSSLIKPAVPIIRGAMENAVLEAAADGKLEDSSHVRERISQAKKNITHSLFGNIERLKA